MAHVQFFGVGFSSELKGFFQDSGSREEQYNQSRLQVMCKVTAVGKPKTINSWTSRRPELTIVTMLRPGISLANSNCSCVIIN